MKVSLFNNKKKMWGEKEPQPSLDYKRHMIMKSKSKCIRIQVASIVYTYNG
jgi:hypothetical protein